MKSCFAMIGFMFVFLVGWAFIEWLAEVTAPVMGPLVLWGVIVYLIVLLVRAYKAAGK
jgi:hypothetical protein